MRPQPASVHTQASANQCRRYRSVRPNDYCLGNDACCNCFRALVSSRCLRFGSRAAPKQPRYRWPQASAQARVCPNPPNRSFQRLTSPLPLAGLPSTNQWPPMARWLHALLRDLIIRAGFTCCRMATCLSLRPMRRRSLTIRPVSRGNS